ncbi:MAG: hypothetical protein WDO74_22405 [Pseudomonadota bacterium]
MIRVEAGFDAELLRGGSSCAERRMIGQGLPIYVALEPVDMRFGYERLGGLVREKMQAEPRSKRFSSSWESAVIR